MFNAVAEQKREAKGIAREDQKESAKWGSSIHASILSRKMPKMQA